MSTAGRGGTPVAAPEAMVELLTGPVRDGRVLSRFSRAAVLALVPAGDGPAPVLAVLAPGAAGTPHGLRLTGPDATTVLTAAAPESAVTVGGGVVTVAGLELRVGRTVPSRIRPDGADPDAVTVLRRLVVDHPTGLPIGENADELVSAVLWDAAADPTGALLGLIGRGPGSTPSGDDLLAGLLAGLWATGRTGPAERIGAAARRLAPGRTTLVSADLLGWAARGHAGSELLAVVTAARTPPGPGLDRAARRLLAVGHTSGADLLAGLVVGLSGSQRPPAGPDPRPGPRTRPGKDAR